MSDLNGGIGWNLPVRFVMVIPGCPLEKNRAILLAHRIRWLSKVIRTRQSKVVISSLCYFLNGIKVAWGN
jgi:hypothetical protein